MLSMEEIRNVLLVWAKILTPKFTINYKKICRKKTYLKKIIMMDRQEDRHILILNNSPKHRSIIIKSPNYWSFWSDTLQWTMRKDITGGSIADLSFNKREYFKIYCLKKNVKVSDRATCRLGNSHWIIFLKIYQVIF